MTKIVRVPKFIYNDIRSFVESSSKLEYYFIYPSMNDCDAIMIRKSDKWVLEVYSIHSQVLHITNADLEIYVPTHAVKVNYYPPENIERPKIIELRGIDVIMPREPVPFAVPIQVSEIIEKAHELAVKLHNNPPEIITV